MGSVKPHVHTVPNQSTLQSQLFYPFSIPVGKKKSFHLVLILLTSIGQAFPEVTLLSTAA